MFLRSSAKSVKSNKSTAGALHPSDEPIKCELDLSQASKTGLQLIFCRASAIELVKNYMLVSKKWYAVLSENNFWKEKMEYDDYYLPTEYLNKLVAAGVHLSTIAVKRPFGRNFIRDKILNGGNTFQFDERWRINGDVEHKQLIYNGISDRDKEWNNNSSRFIYEVPPLFLRENWEDGQPKQKYDGCLATSYSIARKSIVIDLAKEGLTAEILEKMRPTIVVNEMFAFRADAAGSYDFKCLLVDRTLKDEDYDYYDDYYSEDSDDDPDFDPETEDSEEDEADEEMEIDINEDEGSEKEDDKGGVDAAAGIANEQRQFSNVFRRSEWTKQWEKQKWREMRAVFNNYSPNVRYLKLTTGGEDKQFWRGYYGPKMINCSVKVLCDVNLPIPISAKDGKKKSPKKKK